MDHYLAPFLAVVFFLLLGVFIYFFYYKPCKRKEDVDVNKEQLNDAAADCDFVEKKRSNSAVNDYFVVVHLWYICTQPALIRWSLAIIAVPGRNIIDILNTDAMHYADSSFDGARFVKAMS